ncbi:hypothetical protein JKP88DRAFT_244349 [Tribonema minus]|uniref:Uncharacterized protein n=1 Tax=Tribonema minus TaxID=303371 RepID=A0A835Z649_9STRA|nr:hypothetical protein JKP88DRAFT_244349 [Tribonema minus]
MTDNSSAASAGISSCFRRVLVLLHNVKLTARCPLLALAKQAGIFIHALIMVALPFVHGDKGGSPQRRLLLVAITATLLASISFTTSALPHDDGQQPALRRAIRELQSLAAHRKLVDCAAQAAATCGPGTDCATCANGVDEDTFKKDLKDLLQGATSGGKKISATTCIGAVLVAVTKALPAGCIDNKAFTTAVSCVADEPCNNQHRLRGRA